MLKNKNIVITGASKGIGKKIADYLSSNNAYTVINISRTRNSNPRVKNLACDISNYAQVKKTFKKIKNIDVLINNSAITRFSKNTIKNFDKIIKTNLNGFFYCSHEALRLLKKNDSLIINIASINAHQAFPNNPGYVSSKGAIISLTKALALDFGRANVRVNSISPGYINEGMSAKSYKNSVKKNEKISRMIIKRWGLAKDLFGAIEFLMSSKSSYITGQDIVIDGGWLAKGL
jgi:NAD(P)-dependent dehydrogenase (short-subunit alcohol dehydrogenase family)